MQGLRTMKHVLEQSSILFYFTPSFITLVECEEIIISNTYRI
jgi:hypothetical protein